LHVIARAPVLQPATLADVRWAGSRNLAGLLCLLLLCLLHGMRATAGLEMPPDLDALRDIGFAQGMLDGNWLGDPSSAEGLRYYPPLVPALGALLARAIGTGDLPGLWVRIGPWAGLLPVVAFFVLARRIFASSGAALCGTAAFVLLNGATIDPWLAGGYTPWLLTPMLVQAGFLATACLIHARAGSAALRDAVWIGLAIGLTFLGHIIPALLLTAMLLAAVAVSRPWDGRTLGWLALAGSVQGAVMAPYLLPLLATYPGGVVHLTPGNWTASTLVRSWGTFALMLEANAPALLAALVGLHLWRRLDRKAAAMLAAWIGICVLALARHYACGNGAGGACQVLRLPVHHFHLYLQVAGALLIGRVGAALLSWRRSPGLQFVACALAAVTGIALLVQRPYDIYATGVARGNASEVSMDLAAYRWVLAATPPNALFATLGTADRPAGDEPGNFAVVAAGRRLIATDTLFSNPYLDWNSREARRRAAIAWLRGGAVPIACADFAHGLWAMLPTAIEPTPGRADLVFSTPSHAVFAVRPQACAPGAAPTGAWWQVAARG
jgi:hypothetical protein